MVFNYQEICSDLLDDLPERTRKVLIKRFGLRTGKKESLQSVGEELGISRERVRQIQGAGLFELRKKAEKYRPIFSFFSNQLKTTGNLRKEDILLKILGLRSFEQEVFFLLSLADGFDRFLESQRFHTLWTIDRNALDLAQKATEKVYQVLRKKSRPVETEELESFGGMKLNILLAYLEVSKFIQKGPQGLWGLSDWPEINPKGVRDKAYIIFTREKRPLHFREVAQLINESGLFDSTKKAHPQTVHNELIKDERFILVGRGLYALEEWGYRPGTVRDIIIKIFKEVQKPLTKEEIIEKVLEQRFVAKNTILLNLHDRKYFRRNSQGKYEPLLS